jgi:hypothetical protein
MLDFGFWIMDVCPVLNILDILFKQNGGIEDEIKEVRQRFVPNQNSA